MGDLINEFISYLIYVKKRIFLISMITHNISYMTFVKLEKIEFKRGILGCAEKLIALPSSDNNETPYITNYCTVVK